MSTIVAVGDNGNIKETFEVSEPVGLAAKVINKRNKELQRVEPTFGTEAWSFALEFKSVLALVSENKAKDKEIDLFYDTTSKRLVSI